MKKEKQHPITYEHAFNVFSAIVLLATFFSAVAYWVGVLYPTEELVVVNPVVDTKEGDYKEVYDDDYGFVLARNGYSGWQMGCNYANGSDSWNQEYLSCANSLLYRTDQFD